MRGREISGGEYINRTKNDPGHPWISMALSYDYHLKCCIERRDLKITPSGETAEKPLTGFLGARKSLILRYVNFIKWQHLDYSDSLGST